MLPDLENLPCRNYGSGAGLFSFYTLKYFSVIFIHNLYAFLPLAVKKKKKKKKVQLLKFSYFVFNHKNKENISSYRYYHKQKLLGLLAECKGYNF